MRKLVHLAAAVVLGAMAPLALRAAPAAASPRQIIPLSGDWLFQREGAKADDWKSVPVPSSFEQHEGIAFDGVGWYRKSVPAFTLPAGKRALVHFQAAATEAEVWWNGEKLGTHVGGWTPFRFDITDVVRKAPPGQPHELRVRLDEKAGHNTQGFLPIIAPHFGGLWQEVELLVLPETYGDDLRLLAVGDLAKSAVQLEIPLAGTVPKSLPPVSLRCRLRGETNWTAPPLQTSFAQGRIHIHVPLANPRPWSPTEPNLYELQISVGDQDGDRIDTRAGFRTIEVVGQQVRLNGQPLQIRGLLNWGYSPPLTQPNPGEGAWRQEIELARTRGFNLMKFCLWIPPKRYHELADELGMLTWAECPTWHPTLTQKFLEPLRREFSEFFYYDRNHPSVVLRSLTCETGSGAELPVIQNLYDLAKAIVPGAVVEDDSSWIGWNRVHDFYDDHPYGNNHTWVKALQGFNDYILAHGTKPMVLGESIAADTWIDQEAIATRLGAERPWWSPGPLDAVPNWLDRMRAAAGSGGLDRLSADSLRYGLLMRKYQIEAFRREIPAGGYVITVIRDFPLCSMGFLDYLGRPKWTEADWAWHRDTICLLKTDLDRRSFSAGSRLHGEILLSHFGQQVITDGALEVTLEVLADQARGEGQGARGSLRTATLQRWSEKNLRQNPGTLARRTQLDWPLPLAETPKQLVLRATLHTEQGEFQNDWPVWIAPEPRPGVAPAVRLHSSISDVVARELFPQTPRLDKADAETVVVASRFDDDLVRLLENGGRVLLLPDGKKNSFPLSSHWFLRGAPVIPDHALTRKIPRDMLLELQHFDLASEVIPDIDYLENIDPVLMLWDTHDLKTIKTHALVFETRAAKGRLLVSALNHAGQANAAGRWLLQVFLEHLASPAAPRNALSDGLWTSVKSQLHAERTNLTTRTMGTSGAGPGMTFLKK